VIVLCGLETDYCVEAPDSPKKTMEDLIIEGEVYQLIWGPGKEVPDF
jgi:hypothetical protein